MSPLPAISRGSFKIADVLPKEAAGLKVANDLIGRS